MVHFRIAAVVSTVTALPLNNELHLEPVGGRSSRVQERHCFRLEPQVVPPVALRGRLVLRDSKKRDSRHLSLLSRPVISCAI